MGFRTGTRYDLKHSMRELMLFRPGGVELMASGADTVTKLLENGSNTLPNELVGLLLVVGIIFTAIVVLMRKSPFYIIGRVLIFLARIVRAMTVPFIRLLRALRILSKARVKTPMGTPAPGPSLGVAFARTIAKKTETDITLDTGFDETINKFKVFVTDQKNDVLKTYSHIQEAARKQIKELDPQTLVSQYLSNELDESVFRSGEMELPEITDENSEAYLGNIVTTIKLIIIRKALDALTEREEYELRILKQVTPKEREQYIELDNQALRELRQTKRSLVSSSGLVFTKLDIQDIIDDSVYEGEDKSLAGEGNTSSTGDASERDLVKARYFFTYDVPVRRKINPQSLYEDVQGSNIVELFRFSDRKNFYVLSEMRKLINANIMKLSVLLSAIVYVIFIINIFFSSSIPFSRGFILPYLQTTQSAKADTGTGQTQPAAEIKSSENSKVEQNTSVQENKPAETTKSGGEPAGDDKGQSENLNVSDNATDKKANSKPVNSRRLEFSKGIKEKEQCRTSDGRKSCQTQYVPVVILQMAMLGSMSIEASTIDKAIFGILSCLFGMFIMWLFYQKEYTEFQLYNGARLDNFMQRCLNRISVNYQITVSNNVLSMQRPDNLDNMIENSSKWTTLLPWITFRAFYLEFFLRNVMYQILRNSSYYLLFIPMVFFVVILSTAYIIDLETFTNALLEQNTFYVLFLLLIYLYYRYLRSSVTFILDTIKEETWQEFHDLKVQNSMKRYVQAWAQNLKQWRDARKSTDGL